MPRSLLTPWHRVGAIWERSLRRPYTDAQVRETADGRGWWCLVRIDADGRHVIREELADDIEAAKAAATEALRERARGEDQ